MWSFSSLLSGLPPIPPAPLGAFRLLLGAALVWKFGWEHHWGAAHYFDRSSLTRWRYERRKLHVKLVVSPASYRVFYSVRLVAAVALLAGFQSRTGAAVLAAWLFFEFTFDRKFHTAFLGLCCAVLALSPDTEYYLSIDRLLKAETAGQFLSPGPAARPVGDPWPQVLVVLLTVQMYWSSVWHKAHSTQFRRGDVLCKAIEHYTLIRDEMPYREVWYPGWLTRRLVLGDAECRLRRWRWAALATIGLEAILPVLLLVPATWRIGALLGVALHSAFTALFPKRLLPFSLATVAAYPLFLDPATVTRWLAR